MENYGHDQAEEKLDLMSFDLGEANGGKQMIFASKPINDKEYYVLTLGDGPKPVQSEAENQAAATNANPAAKANSGKQLLDSIRTHIPGLKNTAQPAAATDAKQENNIKLRCFKLSRLEGLKFAVEEYVTPQGISDVARFFGAGKHLQETGR